MPAAGAIGAGLIGGIFNDRANRRYSREARNAQMSADEIQRQANQQAFDLEREQRDYERWLEAARGAARQPYLDASMGIRTNNMTGGGGIGGEDLSFRDFAPEAYAAADPFAAPTQAEAENDPAYQFALAEGNKGIEGSAAARGTLLTGGTLKDLQAFGKRAASDQYDKVYGRALNAYQMREALRQAAYDRNVSAGFQSAGLHNQGVSSLRSHYLALAGLASPGAYPGSFGGGGFMPNPGMPGAPRRSLGSRPPRPTAPAPAYSGSMYDDNPDEYPVGY